MPTSESDKRKHPRLNAFLAGTFRTGDGIQGLAMLLDFSRGGFKCAFNRAVPVGAKVDLEIRLPSSVAAIPASGTVRWVEKSTRGWTYEFEVGVEVSAIDAWDKARILDYAYEFWRKSSRQPPKADATRATP